MSRGDGKASPFRQQLLALPRVLDFVDLCPHRTSAPRLWFGTPAAGLHTNLLARVVFVAMVSSDSPGQWIVEPCLA
jgi:hypothetical protein